MKDSLKYFLLWQKKRDELPISDDPQVDWIQMQSLLDVHLPVKKSEGFKGFKTFPAILVTFSAAAMIYLAGNIYQLGKHSHAAKHQFHNGNPVVRGPAIADSSSLPGAETHRDSLSSTGKNAVARDSVGPDGKRVSNSTAVLAAAADTKKAFLQAPANKSGGGIASADIQAGKPAAGRGNNGREQNAAANSKNGYRPGGSLAHSSHRIVPGNGSASPVKTTDQTMSGNNTISDNTIDQKTAATEAFNNRKHDEIMPPALPLLLRVDMNLNNIQPATLSRFSGAVNKMPALTGNQAKGNKKDKTSKPKNTTPSNIDWGILLGVNGSGSFTPESQNANFYGSAPIDPYFGLFASYKINSNWAIAPQLRLFSPQSIVTSYSHANQSKVDSNQSLTITASRKMYAVSVPVYAVYNTGNGLSIKAGPVINFPVKQINTGSVLLPYNIRTDTSYYMNLSGILSSTQYRQSINFGFSVGASYQYKRFIFEATYLKSISGYTISNSLGSFKSNNGTFQFTIGFQLDKVKP